MRRGTGQLVCLCFAQLLGARAQAAEGRVELELHACAAISESALREHLALELTTLGLSETDARLSLTCEQGAVVIELIGSNGAAYPALARVAFDDTARTSRERLIALSASELIARATTPGAAELSPLTTGPAEPAPPAASSFERSAPPSSPGRRRRLDLLLAATAALAGAPRAVLWGGSLGASGSVSQHWQLLFDTRFERGELRLALADVSWTSLSSFAGAGVSARAGPLRFLAGAGVRAGWLSLSASAPSPNEGRRLTAPWAGVAAPLRVAVDVGGFVSPFVGAEAGLVLARVRGEVENGNALVEQRGPWLCGSVGAVLGL